jgi:hypothetical protein
MAQRVAADRRWGDEADPARLQQHRVRLEQVLALLREREAAHRARGATRQGLRDAIRGFALELGRVRSRLRALERAQVAGQGI